MIAARAFLSLVGAYRAMLRRAREMRWRDPVGAATLLGAAYLLHDELDALVARKGCQ